MKNLVLITEVGIKLAVPIVLCTIIGNWIDGLIGTKWIFSIIMIILGIASGFLSVYKLIMSLNSDEKEDENSGSKW